MAEYIDREKIHFHRFFDAGDYSQATKCINNMTPADVIERSKIDKAIEEIEALEKYEMERFSEDAMYHRALKKFLEIFKRNIGEDDLANE